MVVIVVVEVNGGLETNEVTFCPAIEVVIVVVFPGQRNWMTMILTVTEVPPLPFGRPGKLLLFEPGGKTPATALFVGRPPLPPLPLPRVAVTVITLG